MEMLDKSKKKMKVQNKHTEGCLSARMYTKNNFFYESSKLIS